MKVSVSGPTFSSLLYDQNESENDQEGFLLGYIENHVTDIVSDAHPNTTRADKVLHIYGYVRCGGSFSWHKQDGSKQADQLKYVLGDRSQKDVVGWYKYRRNCTMKVSMREHATHCQLQDAFPSVAPQDFVFGLFTVTSGADCNATAHHFDHAFYAYSSRQFKAMSVTTANLQDTSHTEYRIRGMHTVEPEWGSYRETIAEFRDLFVRGPKKLHDTEAIQDINSSLQSRLLELSCRLATSEEDIENLCCEITTLENALVTANDDEDVSESAKGTGVLQQQTPQSSTDTSDAAVKMELIDLNEHDRLAVILQNTDTSGKDDNAPSKTTNDEDIATGEPESMDVGTNESKSDEPFAFLDDFMNKAKSGTSKKAKDPHVTGRRNKTRRKVDKSANTNPEN